VAFNTEPKTAAGRERESLWRELVRAHAGRLQLEALECRDRSCRIAMRSDGTAASLRQQARDFKQYLLDEYEGRVHALMTSDDTIEFYFSDP
jgi:hypothetical protein